jgi:hypothetical protein
MEKITKYLKEVLGVTAGYKKLPDNLLGKMPFYLKSSYEFGAIEIFNHQVIVMKVKDGVKVNTLHIHLEKVKMIFEKPVIAEIPSVEAYQRQRLINKHVPFIIPGKQLFLPDLMISLKEYGNQGVEDYTPVEMPPAAQLILLYHLQIKPLEGYNFGGIAKETRLYPMAVTRAAYFLHINEICRIEGTKDKTLRFTKSGRELWIIAEPKMVNPVKKDQYYSGYTLDKNLKKSNINALSHYTDLNDDPVEYYAMRPGYGKFIGVANLRPAGKIEGNIFIEEWKYDPGLLTKTDYIDPLSLYLCFRENKNERIEGAIEDLINNIKW